MNHLDVPEDDVKITSFIKNGMGLEEEHLQAILDHKFNRKHLESYEEAINKTWNERLKGQETLYNALKFRYHSVEEIDNGNKIKMNLGITAYKSLIGTNLVDDPQKIALLKAEGMNNYGNEDACFALPLGVGSLLRTVDNKFVYMRRSNLCAENQGVVDRPGGHPEPQVNIFYCSSNGITKVEKKNLPWYTLSTENNFLFQVLLNKYNETDHKTLYGSKSSDILEELFESIKKEIRDEINIPMEATGQPVLMGIAQVISQASRPSAEFYVR